MQTVLDLLTSGVHDAKNQLFVAESTVVRAELQHGIQLDEARFAIEQAALRLNRILIAYRSQRGLLALNIGMQRVSEMLDEAVLVCSAHCLNAGLKLEAECSDADMLWPLDRELLQDVLANAMNNASRFARTRILLSADCDGGELVVRVEDDGCGFDTTDPLELVQRGLGLFVAHEIARLHHRGERTGRLLLSNGGALGGAVFELRLP
jgi:signal transduction histidine kinase